MVTQDFTTQLQPIENQYIIFVSAVLTLLQDLDYQIEKQLCELSEFASWLCQWLGSFEILAPRELKEIIDDKVNKHLNNKHKQEVD